jgi:hypothetical protein
MWSLSRLRDVLYIHCQWARPGQPSWTSVWKLFFSVQLVLILFAAYSGDVDVLMYNIFFFSSDFVNFVWLAGWVGWVGGWVGWAGLGCLLEWHRTISWPLTGFQKYTKYAKILKRWGQNFFIYHLCASVNENVYNNMYIPLPPRFPIVQWCVPPSRKYKFRYLARKISSLLMVLNLGLFSHYTLHILRYKFMSVHCKKKTKD